MEAELGHWFLALSFLMSELLGSTSVDLDPATIQRLEL